MFLPYLRTFLYEEKKSTNLCPSSSSQPRRFSDFWRWRWLVLIHNDDDLHLGNSLQMNLNFFMNFLNCSVILWEAFAWTCRSRKTSVAKYFYNDEEGGHMRNFLQTFITADFSLLFGISWHLDFLLLFAISAWALPNNARLQFFGLITKLFRKNAN